MNVQDKILSGDEKRLRQCVAGYLGFRYHFSCVYTHKGKLKI